MRQVERTPAKCVVWWPLASTLGCRDTMIHSLEDAFDIKIALGPGRDRDIYIWWIVHCDEVMHNHVLKNLIGDIVGITLPESESALTHISCYLTNVCLHLPQGGCSGSRDRNQFRFHGRLAPTKSSKQSPFHFLELLHLQKCHVCFPLCDLGRRRKWWQSTSVWWIRWLWGQRNVLGSTARCSVCQKMFINVSLPIWTA